MPRRFAVRELLHSARTRERGQTTAEYGVTLAVITIALLALFTALSGGVQGAVNRVIPFLPS